MQNITLASDNASSALNEAGALAACPSTNHLTEERRMMPDLNGYRCCKLRHTFYRGINRKILVWYQNCCRLPEGKVYK